MNILNWFRRKPRQGVILYANIAKGINVDGKIPVVVDYCVRDREQVLKQWKPEGKVLVLEIDPETLDVIDAWTERK